MVGWSRYGAGFGTESTGAELCKLRDVWSAGDTEQGAWAHPTKGSWGVVIGPDEAGCWASTREVSMFMASHGRAAGRMERAWLPWPCEWDVDGEPGGIVDSDWTRSARWGSPRPIVGQTFGPRRA
ncbi:hypothetical protein ColTof4_06759 [Colletotrichum tofieldiae]|nr:hypothetical protein ColTof3_11702 [Colletotrichum tofieldiae]GKT74336.1 hypothetical protein ColTof4_06759 [Colletotrichum tofieldiae]